MKKFIALMCVATLAMGATFNANAVKKVKAKKINKTEIVKKDKAPVKCEKADAKTCDKVKDGKCIEKKAPQKFTKTGKLEKKQAVKCEGELKKCDKMKGECKGELKKCDKMKGECKGELKKCDKMKGECKGEQECCDKKKEECKGECKH